MPKKIVLEEDDEGKLKLPKVSRGGLANPPMFPGSGSLTKRMAVGVVTL